MMRVGLIKKTLKAAEQGCHGQVHASVAIIHGRVEENGMADGIAEEITAPQIAMQQGGWFRRKDVRQRLIQPLELLLMSRGQQTIGCRQGDLRVQPLMNKEIYPIS